MNTSELIAQLARQLAEHGDQEVIMSVDVIEVGGDHDVIEVGGDGFCCFLRNFKSGADT